ncbi:MAG: glycosyltransferase [Blastocatellia bacterium]
MTVVIPNYNYARYLSSTIDSALNQTWARIEVIVVDDGSKDGSQKILDSYGSKIRWFRQDNQGVSAARNRGAKEGNGELIAFLDADDLWLPTKLIRQIERFLDDPALGLVHCGIIEFNDKDEDMATRMEGLEGWIANDLLLLQQPVVHGIGSSGLVLRDAFDAVGGFDPRLSTSADWDFCYRVARQYRVGGVAEPLVKYRIHGSNMHSNIGVMEHDMLLAFEKAFSHASPEVMALRRQAYGRLHLILAGSWFQQKQMRHFLRNIIRSLWFSPQEIMHLLQWPLRLWRRQQASRLLDA